VYIIHNDKNQPINKKDYITYINPLFLITPLAARVVVVVVVVVSAVVIEMRPMG
jgi:hypothetical protein